MPADGEMIEGLKPRILKAKYLVHRIIEKAPDARRPYPGRLGFKIKHLANEAGLPKEATVKPGTIFFDGRFKLGDHTHRKSSGAGDLLMAAHLSCQLSGIALL